MRFALSFLSGVFVFGVLGFFYVLDNGSGGDLNSFLDVVVRPAGVVSLGVALIYSLAAISLRDTPDWEDTHDDP